MALVQNCLLREDVCKLCCFFPFSPFNSGLTFDSLASPWYYLVQWFHFFHFSQWDGSWTRSPKNSVSVLGTDFSHLSGWVVIKSQFIRDCMWPPRQNLRWQNIIIYYCQKQQEDWPFSSHNEHPRPGNVEMKTVQEQRSSPPCHEGNETIIACTLCHHSTYDIHHLWVAEIIEW